MFELDPRLEADTVPVTELVLCRVLLMNYARFAWLILVPRKPGLSELTDLGVDDRDVLMGEIAAASDALTTLYAPEKINIGALGNIVRQLHIHVVARNSGDAAWPGPVWGQGAATPYAAAALEKTLAALAGALPRVA
jgi:diadenosine tetraphosphate (Ap4A) HIT family hydrolase